MRNALLATIVLALSGVLLGAATLLPEILCANAFFPPSEPRDFRLTTAKNAVASQNKSGKSGSLPGKGAIATGTTASSQEWAERMFTGGLSKDFGAVPFGTRLCHRFELTNIYSVPVEITGLRVGCGCVTATPGQRILQPGESTTSTSPWTPASLPAPTRRRSA